MSSAEAPSSSQGASSSEAAKKITLTSQDGDTFTLVEKAALRSKIINSMLEDNEWDGTPIPLPVVKSEVLVKVIQYLEKHHELEDQPDSADELKAWDAELVKLEKDDLFKLILAANYLEIKELLDLGCQAVADSIRNKTPQEIRDHFGLLNDFSPEEEAENQRSANQWVYSDPAPPQN